MSLPAIVGAFFTEVKYFGASEMTIGLGFASVFAMVIAGFVGGFVIRSMLQMTQKTKLRNFAYYSFVAGAVTLAVNFVL